MAFTIRKYQLSEEELLTTIAVHEKFKVLHVGYQEGKKTVWVLIDLESPEMELCFKIIGTGWNEPLLDKFAFVGTIQSKAQSFVWHVFCNEKPTL